MFLRGINYDIGTEFVKGQLSRPEFDESIIKNEIGVIKNVLNCDAIRISGYDIKRLIRASEFALKEGLQVWFSPAFLNAEPEEAKEYLKECAEAAETLRKKYDHLIFIAGCEYSVFLKGFIRGDNIRKRLATLFNPAGILFNMLGLRKKVYASLNIFLKETTKEIKTIFKGKITYASGIWEKIDWSLFDYVGIDHYRASYNKSSYIKQLRNYKKYDKPVVVLEFGCCTYRGAAEKGGAGWMIVGVKDGRPYIMGNYQRNESVQADYIIEVLDILISKKIYGAFVFTFVNPVYKFNSDPEYDLDMASYGIVKSLETGAEKTYKGLPWLPKESFYRLADYYKDRGNKKP